MVLVILLLSCVVYAGDPQDITATSVEKYNFKLYVLAKGRMKKTPVRPDFGWRVLKAFPLKVREFTYPAPYMDPAAPEFKAAAENILNSIDVQRRKNAVRVADAVFDFISASITARAVTEEIAESPGRVYYSALQCLNNMAGSTLEKCRLAVAMLRYFLVPARIISRDGGYEVEYYIQPLTEQGKGAWYVTGFDSAGQELEEYFVPADWHPIDAKELLREQWAAPMFVKLKQQKRNYITDDDAGAIAVFTALTEAGKAAEQNVRPKKGGFHVIDELLYELWLPAGVTEAKAEFTLPFNLEDQLDIKDDFKTVKYFAVTDDERLAVKSKWPQTKTKPSQEGIIYTLPVSFTVGKTQ